MPSVTFQTEPARIRSSFQPVRERVAAQSERGCEGGERRRVAGASFAASSLPAPVVVRSSLSATAASSRFAPPGQESCRSPSWRTRTGSCRASVPAASRRRSRSSRRRWRSGSRPRVRLSTWLIAIESPIEIATPVEPPSAAAIDARADERADRRRVGRGDRDARAVDAPSGPSPSMFAWTSVAIRFSA